MVLIINKSLIELIIKNSLIAWWILLKIRFKIIKILSGILHKNNCLYEKLKILVMFEIQKEILALIGRI